MITLFRAIAYNSNLYYLFSLCPKINSYKVRFGVYLTWQQLENNERHDLIRPSSYRERSCPVLASSTLPKCCRQWRSRRAVRSVAEHYYLTCFSSGSRLTRGPAFRVYSQLSFTFELGANGSLDFDARCTEFIDNFDGDDYGAAAAESFLERRALSLWPHVSWYRRTSITFK